MAYDEKSLVALVDKTFQPPRSVQIEVICRLVEQQDLRTTDELAGKPESTPLTPAQFGHLPTPRCFGIEAKAVKNSIHTWRELVTTLSLESL